MSRRPARADAGATIVEAAFALPILLMFIFALVDLGMWTFNSNQATNAAKDGARAAIVQHRTPCDDDGDSVVDDGDGLEEANEWCGVDEEHSIPWNRAVARIERRIDRDLGAADVDIRCEAPDGTVKDCWSATVDVDRVRVEVDWTWDLLTPVAGVVGLGEGEASGVATMTVIGKPVGEPRTVTPDTEPPPAEPPPTPEPTTPCTVSNVKAGNPVESNGVVKITGVGELQEPIYVTFTTNGADRCSGLSVQLSAPDGTLRSATCLSCNTTSQQWVFNNQKERIWSPVGTVTQGSARIYNEWVVPGVTKHFGLGTSG